MNKKILILKEQDRIWTYLWEDGEVVEIHVTSDAETEKSPAEYLYWESAEYRGEYRRGIYRYRRSALLL